MTLALVQVDEIIDKIKSFYHDFKAQIIVFSTTGDKDKKTPVSQIEGTDFFTREIDQAVLSGKADFAVHSAKDLPDKLRQGLETVLVTAPMEQNDVIVSKKNMPLCKLPKNAKIGTSSIKRKTQLRDFRPDFQIIDIRGNIEERINILDNTNLDAVVIAQCALVRLGLENRISQKIPLPLMRPHPLQGSLSVVIKSNNREMANFFKHIKNKEVKPV
ncbi:hydroxymethylbilane synthase [bacterium]|nr:hydroxymethylbilane synthase [bacterium]